MGYGKGGKNVKFFKKRGYIFRGNGGGQGVFTPNKKKPFGPRGGGADF